VATQYWTALGDGRVRCDLCPRECKMAEGQRGLCFVRANDGGQVVLTSYGRSSGFCIDPIEKKPLNHFLPGTPVLFLPHGWVSDFARMRHRAEADKDIDVYSSGTLTDHRMKVFRALGERGHRVVWDSLGVPDYLRFEHLSRAKVCMSLKLSATSEVPSVSRLHFLLEHACAIAHERCAQTSPLDPYLLHLPGDELIEWCEAMLTLPDRREIAEGAATRFAAELPMSRLLPPILSASLNGRVRHAVTA
jgi:hypothetical protein